MKTTGAILLAAAMACATLAAAESAVARPDERLQRLLDDSVEAVLKEFATNKLQTNQIAVTLVDVRDRQQLRQASYRGDAAIYPASVVKLFYLAAAHRWMEDGTLKDSAELRRALKDMIVDSSNDATHYVLDTLTGTTSGPELPDDEMKQWGEKRNAVNRYFASIGFKNINCNQKPWCEGPYGRDRIWVGKDYTNRNALTTDATARLLAEIALGQCVSAARSSEMMELMLRDFSPKTEADDQGHRFTALGLPREAKLWSKAGWTSTARHDAAYVELPDGRKFVLVTFTTSHANERGIIAGIAKRIVEKL